MQPAGLKLMENQGEGPFQTAHQISAAFRPDFVIVCSVLAPVAVWASSNFITFYLDESAPEQTLSRSSPPSSPTALNSRSMVKKRFNLF
jgi:hypothetical protein